MIDCFSKDNITGSNIDGGGERVGNEGSGPLQICWSGLTNICYAKFTELEPSGRVVLTKNFESCGPTTLESMKLKKATVKLDR